MKVTDMLLVGAFIYVLLQPTGEEPSVSPDVAQKTLRSWETLVGQGMLDVAKGCHDGTIKTETDFYSASSSRSMDAFDLAWKDGIASAMSKAFPTTKDAEGNTVSTFTPEKGAELYEVWGKHILEHVGE